MCIRWKLLILLAAMTQTAGAGELKTWDGKHSIEKIEVTAVYFVPRDRAPLPDWRERVDYFCGRIEAFHAREFEGQSTLATTVVEQPFVSSLDAAALREGDGDAIYFRTLREVDSALDFGEADSSGFPILLVFSDINWRPLDDFYRLRPEGNGFAFEGNYNGEEHFPGAASGGARAAYLAREGKGWGLVSADGWRVPYRGSDCVVYHEGCGHTVGLPHPEPGNGSVMSLGQYQGWLSESWLDADQKSRLGWTPGDEPRPRDDLFSVFSALPSPKVPKPGEPVSLKLTWPRETRVRRLTAEIQTDLFGPWINVTPAAMSADPPESLALGRFDRPTPVSYRVRAELENGESAELWGYLQVRSRPDAAPQPRGASVDLAGRSSSPVEHEPAGDDVDLLALIRPEEDAVSGDWTLDGKTLVSPRAYGARIEIPSTPPEAYRLVIVAEPLDSPNGLILGQLAGESRFLTLLNYAVNEQFLSAVENVDGRNVGNNATTRSGRLFETGRLSQVVCHVLPGQVQVDVDGLRVIDWTGDSSQLSLSDYWRTPHADRLFLGAYDCRYRFHRVTLTPLQIEKSAN